MRHFVWLMFVAFALIMFEDVASAGKKNNARNPLVELCGMEPDPPLGMGARCFKFLMAGQAMLALRAGEATGIK